MKGFVPALGTPFDKDGKFLKESYMKQIDDQIKAGAVGVLSMGSMGAQAMITSEEYPSLGYMIQQEATTIWERFELKKSASMNSHNHPMYGAVDYWFYAYLLGVKPLESGWKKAQIRPYMPEKLLSAQGTVETVLGDITVRWVKQYEQVDLHVTIPFGMAADVHTPKGIYTVGSGFYHYHWKI